MSRTHKDKKWEIRFPEERWDFAYTRVDFDYKDYTIVRYLDRPGVKTKKRKTKDTEWHWMSTPSWWTRLTMNRSQRRKGRLWERHVHFEDIEETDPPGVSHKPHNYYY